MFPPGRYGRRREPRRTRTAVTTFVLVSTLLAILALTVALYLRFGDPAYEAQVVTYTDVTDETFETEVIERPS